MAEASKFLSYCGSKRKVSSENETDMEKKSKSSEYKFSIIKLWKYQKDFLFWNLPNEKPCNNPSKRVTWIEFDANKKKNTGVGFVNNKRLHQMETMKWQKVSCETLNQMVYAGLEIRGCL